MVVLFIFLGIKISDCLKNGIWMTLASHS